MKFPKLYPIIDVTVPSAAIAYAKELFAADIKIVQLRAKHLSIQEQRTLAEQILRLRNELVPNCVVIVNDSPQVALECGADGVHLGQEDCSPEGARALLGEKAIIGFSTHNLEQLNAAPFDVLNYVAFGPVFDSPTKSGHAPTTGVEMLREAAAASPLPLVAIGGINESNAGAVYAAGAASIALISALRRRGLVAENIASFELIGGSI